MATAEMSGLIAAATAARRAITAGRSFFAEKDMIVQGALQHIRLPAHFLLCQVATFPRANLATGRQQADGNK